jgi:hypothetical protein
MRYRTISTTAFIAFILTAFMPLSTKLPNFLQMSPVLAQTADARHPYHVIYLLQMFI